MGMRGTGNWAENQVPESWAQYILHEYPNGSAPLYAMTSMFRQENVDSYKYHWWDKTLPTQAGAVTSVYIDAGLATEYTYAAVDTYGIAGAVLYAKVALALAKEFKDGDMAALVTEDAMETIVRGIVQDTFHNGANSYIAIKLIEADDNAGTPSATASIQSADRIFKYGSAYPEGSTAPNAIMYDPNAYDNYVQNYRDTLDLTETAMATRLRTGDAYKEARADCAEAHSLGIEKSAFWGEKYNGTGHNGKPLRTTQGIYAFLQENNSANIVNYITDTDTDYAGKTWLQAGKKFLNTYLTRLFRYMKGEAVAFCGDAALLGIMELAEAYGNIQLQTGTVSYGIDVTTWQIPAGRLHLKTHPLFSHETMFQNTMVIVNPANHKFCPLANGGKNFRTKFEKDMQLPGQHSKVDGFSTKGGWKHYFPNQSMWMNGIGKANTA